MKYRFEVAYQTKIMQKMNALLQSLDIGEKAFCTVHDIEFSSEKKLEIAAVKVLIALAYESDGCVILRIEGGKVE